MGIDPFLIQAAAQASPPRLSAYDPRLERAVEVLPNAERVDYLKRLLRGEANLQSKLRRRLQQIPGLDLHESFIPGRRTYSELRGVADGLRRNADIRAKAKAEANRVRELRAFAAQAPGAWQTVEAEIERKNASSYDRAVALLVKLRDLAVLQNEVPAFRRQLDVLLERYKSRPGFQDRVRKARL